jgi:hypothetical protein
MNSLCEQPDVSADQRTHGDHVYELMDGGAPRDPETSCSVRTGVTSARRCGKVQADEGEARSTAASPSSADGSTTQLATWQSQCPVCGEPITIQTTWLHRLREPNRRCPDHRRRACRCAYD